MNYYNSRKKETLVINDDNSTRTNRRTKKDAGIFTSFIEYRKNGAPMKVQLTKIKVEKLDFVTPYCDPETKQSFVVLNQKGI
ncbi:hypothetical protein [Aquimarina algicola]|uniref:Uncharacterized protein n=1 Tax=Aquimarina algicola TaxID=2589995 RepID=A0A504J9S8_9FLAO|nr:hypothetical protein [Aquimarina algicola]TPN87394.1 hypothetical protein FHK87_07360 [Aquimarina algicola]